MSKPKKDGPSPRRPDYDVAALSKRTGYKGRVGAAWKNDKGQISISLNPFVVLDASDDLSLTLFPVEPGPPRVNDPPPRDPGPPESEPDPAPGGDPIPF